MLRAELLQVTDDDAAWRSLTGEVRRAIRRKVADEATVDDLVQDVLTRVHARADDLRDDERLAAWVGRITRSIVADHYRASRPTAPLPDEPAADVPEDEFATAPRALWVATQLERLDPPYRDVLRLTEIEGLTQRQAAERLGLSLPAVKSRVLRGRAKLEESLRRCCRIELDRRGGVVDWSPNPGCC